MNSLLGRRGPLDAQGDGTAPPPDAPRAPGPGRPRGGRSAPGSWLVWFVLGATLVAVERLAMLVFALPGSTPTAQGVAAAVLSAVWLIGVLAGGVAFGRAWRRSRQP